METVDLNQILQEIKDYCRKHEVCRDCKFDLYEGCALSHVPDEWNLDKVDWKKEGEENA